MPEEGQAGGLCSDHSSALQTHRSSVLATPAPCAGHSPAPTGEPEAGEVSQHVDTPGIPEIVLSHWSRTPGLSREATGDQQAQKVNSWREDGNTPGTLVESVKNVEKCSRHGFEGEEMSRECSSRCSPREHSWPLSFLRVLLGTGERRKRETEGPHHHRVGTDML